MVWHCTLITPSTGCIMDSLYTAEPEISPLFISLIKTWCLHYPACNFAKEWHHWKQFFFGLHAASCGATKAFTQFPSFHQEFCFVFLSSKNQPALREHVRLCDVINIIITIFLLVESFLYPDQKQCDDLVVPFRRCQWLSLFMLTEVIKGRRMIN